MKKITLMIVLLIVSSTAIGQVLNQDANWPNTSWDLDGTFETATNIFTGNPTITLGAGGSESFSFDEDEAGGSSINDIGVQSPTINLTSAFTAGETILKVSSTYVLNVYQNESLNLQYWDADANNWVNWGPTYTNTTPGAPNVNFCSGTSESFNSDELDISAFTSSQLSGFRYRIYYNDNGSFGWGICFDSPNISSDTPPNCSNITDLTLCNITDSSVNVSWSAGSDEIAWEVNVLPQGSGVPASGTPVSSNDSYPVSGLSANSGYVAYVRADCLDGSGFSSWISMPFTTNSAAPAPGAFVFTQNNSVSMSGSSYAAVDMNNDGLDDLIAATSSTLRIAYQSQNGCFTETAYSAPANYGPGWSMAAGDLDGNGYNDILYGAGNGVSFLMANSDGSAYAQSFNTTDYVFSQRSNFIDINNDGHLDAFVCHDVEPNVYFINDGTGSLTYYQGASSSIPNGLGTHANGGNYGTVWIDYDNDGDMDMFIAKCRGGNITHKINELWQNQGDDGSGNITFINVADLGHYQSTFPGQGHNNSSNLGDPVQTWSSAWADFDNDGDLDVYVGASSSADGSHKYMLNNGDGTFTDATAAAGVSSAPFGIENAPADFNNDGYVDILSNGRILLNDGDNSFTVVSSNMPPSGAIGDANNDGFLDVFREDLYLNNPNANNWIKIIPKGVISNSNGIGARLEIVTAMGTQIREIRSGEGFEFMSTLFAHFGIGTDTEIISLNIKWPSGIEDNILNPNINETITIVEGSHPLSLSDSLLDNLIIYPNPVDDIINIETPIRLDSAAYSIYDISGKRVVNTTKLDSNVINVAKLSSGAYILRVITNGENKSQKFIKN